MTKPEVIRFGDGHYWRVIYGVGPYIADYEEQVLLACIVRGWCPRSVSTSVSYVYSGLLFQSYFDVDACHTAASSMLSHCVGVVTIQKC